MTKLIKDMYSFDKELTWTDIHKKKKAYTKTGWLCGIEVDTMDVPVAKMDEFLKTIHPVTLLIPDDLALTLYNTNNNLLEFEGQTHVISIKSGMGKAGTRKGYKFEDDFHQIYTQEKWYKCEPNWFAHYFCTEQQSQMINHIFGRVPGVLYL